MNDKKKKKNIEQWLKHIKKGTNRGITCEKAKKTKQKSKLGFLASGMRAHVEICCGHNGTCDCIYTLRVTHLNKHVHTYH